MLDVYNNIEDYNLVKKRKVLIVFDDMIADMTNNKKINPIVTELFTRGTKLNISIVFITQILKHFFIMKIPNKRELQQIGLLHSLDIDFKDFMKIYKKMYCRTIFPFLVNDFKDQKESFGIDF